MRLATLRIDGGTAAVRVDGTTATVVSGYADLSTLLADPDWESLAANASGDTMDLDDADYAPVVPTPGKIVCVGLNYATHIREMGRDLPEYPTLFAKFREALTGPYDDVVVPSYAAGELDWEAELAVIIGKPAYQVKASDAAAHIAGYTVINDYTMRDYQYRTLQWDQGKSFEKSAGFGPHLVTDYTPNTRITATLDGELMQDAVTNDLVFGPEALVEYISHIVTLAPGDVVITGTTGGVGHARTPARHIQDGETVEVTIEGIGSVKNKTVVR
ncbi:fumarylacetoacetate hydrolase family protein [Tsukamurella sp. 8F]|uniref:fumarylacetoacetate hydrolase family protein n=1 Tax=unclassified Tsukamurella TaxID=2633480 RepID=UPI0023B89B17|nr:MULTISPECIES: fumarylacetoacetate hydrolase family protein [unclassified Tsukamurella]MDF0529244.1 fumarylacetoacetate hydrolase family protein [Tsukamurella sp. 8J]MDF0585429.1 fumarylacetoacetate hydrolase family protein [Tsukamurella sp. 8F]